MKQYSLLFFFVVFGGSLFAQKERPAFTDEVLKTMNIRNIGPAAMSGRITAIAVGPLNGFSFAVRM